MQPGGEKAKESVMSALELTSVNEAADEARRLVYADFQYGAGVPSAGESWRVGLGRPVAYTRRWTSVTTPGCTHAQKLYDGVHVQEFERGVAIVNVSDEYRRVTLGRPHRDLDGGICTSVTLAPHSAEALVRSSVRF
jgi:hypothetical protein